jgi:hypothetical protein
MRGLLRENKNLLVGRLSRRFIVDILDEMPAG